MTSYLRFIKYFNLFSLGVTCIGILSLLFLSLGASDLDGMPTITFVVAAYYALIFFLINHLLKAKKPHILAVVTLSLLTVVPIFVFFNPEWLLYIIPIYPSVEVQQIRHVK